VKQLLARAVGEEEHHRAEALIEQLRTVRQLGGGRYSVWGNFLYFSSSDNSDPRTNGRVYRLRDADL